VIADRLRLAPRARVLAPREVAPGEALALGPILLARTAADRVPHLAASVVRGPAVVLGGAQRAGRVLRLDACAARGITVLRRATAGTAAWVEGRAVIWTLALPHVAALVPDATPRTLLNRNVRGFLRGLGRAAAPAQYFGREWIAVLHQPAALLGFEATAGGEVLVEVIAGIDAPLALPGEVITGDERAVDRWLGKTPRALGALAKGDPAWVAAEVMMAVAEQAGLQVEPVGDVEAFPLPPVAGDDDPMPAGFVAGPGARVPVGWIDTGIDPATGRVWLGGDVLVPAHVRQAVTDGDAVPAEVAVEGGRLADLHDAARRARPPGVRR
jgi:hypothetical protein